MTPDRPLSAEIMVMILVPQMRALPRPRMTFTPTCRLASIAGNAANLIARITSDGLELDHDGHVDQVVVHCGLTRWRSVMSSSSLTPATK